MAYFAYHEVQGQKTDYPFTHVQCATTIRLTGLAQTYNTLSVRLESTETMQASLSAHLLQ
jgi:hypothetical protein